MKIRIIDKENTPWPPINMTSQLWLNQPIVRFAIEDLILTQDGVYFEAVFGNKTPVGGDVYPHVVIWKDEFYLEDGHTRVMRALIAGQPTLYCRTIEP